MVKLPDTQAKIVPFGKYKDQPVELMVADRSYCEWLMAQPWFADKFRDVYNVVVNYGGLPQDSPEHNALQARFLDPDFCLKIAKLVEPKAFDFSKKLEIDKASAIAHREDLLEEAKNNLEKSKEAISERSNDDDSWIFRSLQRELEQCEDKYKHAKSIEFFVENSDFVAERIVFEVGGWDVTFEVRGGYSIVMKSNKETKWFCGFNAGNFSISQIFVEAKPSVGDDYPAILRQITGYKASYGRAVLLAGVFDARGATLDQVRKIFASRGIAIVMLGDVDG